jgi:hypothetical protein
MLSAVAGQLENFHDPVDQYLDHIGKREVLNGCWEKLGISQVLPNNYQPDHSTTIIRSGERAVMNDMIQEGISRLFSNCSIIRFADWSKTVDASRIWYSLFVDIIRPLNKRDMEFIFQLGDVSKKLVFEIDEFLDIMGDYASYGRITLMLDEQEADTLWDRLNGKASYATSAGFRSPGTNEKHLFLFNTMRIDVLLVTGNKRTVMLSRDGHFQLPGRPFNKAIMPTDSSGYFNTGYQLGLLMRLDILLCVALGLVVAGAYSEQMTMPDSSELFTYVHNWMTALQPGWVEGKPSTVMNT